MIDAKADGGWSVLDAEDDLIARPYSASGTADEQSGIRIEDSSGRRVAVLKNAYGSLAQISPDARWLNMDADEPTIYDLRTAKRVPIDIDGRFFGVGYEWLDEDTVAVLAARTETSPVELLSCDVPSGACTVTVDDLGTFQEGRFLIPVGESIG